MTLHSVFERKNNGPVVLFKVKITEVRQVNLSEFK